MADAIGAPRSIRTGLVRLAPASVCRVKSTLMAVFYIGIDLHRFVRRTRGEKFNVFSSFEYRCQRLGIFFLRLSWVKLG